MLVARNEYACPILCMTRPRSALAHRLQEGTSNSAAPAHKLLSSLRANTA